VFWNRPRTDLDAAISRLENRIEALETQTKLLRVEWEEVYDKLSNALARLRKRDRDESKQNGKADDPKPPEGRAALWERAKHLLRKDR